MASEDWYRNTQWNEPIRETFFAKLSRARSQRDQYLVIQALTLAPTFPLVTIELVDFYFETRKDDFDDVRALLAKAEAYKSMNDLPATIEAYKHVLAREKEFPTHKTRTYLDLPYLIALEGVSSEYELASSLLANGLDDIAFPVDDFIWNAACALIADARGQKNLASKHAARAIEVGNVRKSGFRYHQDLGLVGKDYQPVLKRLVALES